jgi:hypothetical protein
MKIELKFEKGSTIKYKRDRLFDEAAYCLGFDGCSNASVWYIVSTLLIKLNLRGLTCSIEFEDHEFQQ